jgi:alkylation response protein AidB-like acyl-CoA dehydrogenase
MSALLSLPYCTLPAEAEALRPQVRAFLAEALIDYPASERARSWLGFDRDFSRKLAQRGWIGMTWPKRYGGGEQSAFARHVVVEELVACGAPVLAHWIADRQSGPLILRFGTEAQKENYLPPITRGDFCFAIGMSEPDAGSDLASVRTRAVKTTGGWIVNGTKVWTSNAHRCQAMIALVRTGSIESRQLGLSQFIVDMPNPDVEVNPIIDMNGEHHFNEVVFRDTFLPDSQLLGPEGNGWAQVTSELTLERSGPERFLSSMPLLIELIRMLGSTPDGATAAAVGRLLARHAVLRQMSVSIAGQIENHQDPQLEAACLKDLGGDLEQLVPEIAHALLDEQPLLEQPASEYARVLARVIEMAPSFTLRGGTREVLRSIIARGVGLR